MTNFLTNALGSLLNVAPIPGANVLGGAINSGLVDPTPGFSAQNVLTTQAKNLLGSSPTPTSQTTAQTGGANIDTGAGGGATTGTTSNTVNAATVAQNSVLQQLLEAALNRLPSQLQTAEANINNTFNTKNNELQSGFNAAQQQNQQQTAQNQQQYRLNKNQIADQASSGLSSLLRVLGAHGAGGSSDYNLVAPQLVAQQASQQRSGAGQTYGQNQQAIDTNWNTYQTGFGNSKKQLNDWLQSQLQGARSNSAQAEQGIQQQLLGIQPTVALAQPYIDRINQLAGQVDGLAALNPTYDGTTPTYTAPSVASYTVNPNTAVTQNASAADSLLSPYLSMLLGKDKNAKQLF